MFSDFPYFFRFYYGLVGSRFLPVVVFLAGATALEVGGISLFLPLLQGAEGGDPITKTLRWVFSLVDATPTFRNVLLLMVVLLALRSLFLAGKDLFMARLTANMLVGIRSRFLASLFDTDYRYFVSKEAGYLNNALTVEFPLIAFAFEQFAVVLAGMLFATMYMVIALTVSPQLGIALLVVAPPIVLIVRWLNIRTRGYAIHTTQESASLQGWMIQALQNYKYLKSTAVFSTVVNRIQLLSASLGRLQFRLAIMQVLSSQVFTVVSVPFVAAVLYYRVEVQGAEILEALFVLFLFKRAIDQAVGIQGSFRKVLLAIGSVRVHQLLDTELRANRETTEPGSATPDFEQAIAFCNVGFRYSDDDPVLRDIEISIPPRSAVAFVGASGAGKSTLVTLLTGLLKPTEGRIEIGGVDYNSLDLNRLRSQTGYVTQEGVIFNDTLKNNITLWVNDVDQERLEGVATQARVTEFLPRLADGYDTTLGDNGVRVSGGQRQRISIARELYKDVKLLILDEATSAIDTATEREIQQSIDRLKGEKTLVLVAHRLSTVRNCDAIYVMKEGRVVENGSYSELYAKGGEFTKMVDLQVVGDPAEQAAVR